MRRNDPTMSDEIYEVQLEDGTQAYFVTDDKHVSKALANEAPAIACDRFTKESKKFRVIRQLCLEEFDQIKEDKCLKLRDSKNKDMGEKWVTTSMKHNKAFKNKGVTPGTYEVVSEITVKKKEFNKGVIGHMIPQRGSRAVNKQMLAEGKRLYNVYNHEHLQKSPRKFNIGLKGPENVKIFNDTVISIKMIDPHSWKYTNSFTQWVSNNKLGIGMAAVGIILDAGRIRAAILNDKGEWGSEVTCTVAEISGGLAGAVAGAEVGALICSIFPLVGTALGGFLGSLLGGILGSLGAEKLAEMWVSLRHLAPGPGPPPLDINPPDHGPPPLDINPPDHGAPPLDIDPPYEGFPQLDVQPPFQGPPGLDILPPW